MKKQTIFLVGTMIAHEPLTVTHKEVQGARGHRLPRAGGHEGAQPIWPASNIRGAIRHALTKVVADIQKEHASKFNLAQFFMMGQGTDIDNALDDKGDMVEIDFGKALREKNPAISLAGRWGLPTKMDIGNAFPRNENCTGVYGQGARRIMFEVNPDLVDDLEQADKIKLHDLLDWQTEASSEKNELKSKLRELFDKTKTATAAEKRLLNDQIGAIQAEISSINKGSEGESASGIRRPLAGYEAFHAGTEFDSRITLHNVSEVEAGLFIAALREFSQYPKLGAKKAYNNGVVSFHWDVLFYQNKKDLKPTKIGTLSAGENGVDLNCPILEAGYAAFAKIEGGDLGSVDFGKIA